MGLTRIAREEIVPDSSVHPEIAPLHITVETAPASDGWGFVGLVMVADHEAYRTFQAFTTPTEALTFAQRLVADMLGGFLAGQEWRQLDQNLGHHPLRADLQFGLSAHRAHVNASTAD
jgi:hypothetical protein